MIERHSDFGNDIDLSSLPFPLVIVNEDREKIADNVGAIFLKYNFLDYKKPDDIVSIDDYYILIAHMTGYVSVNDSTDVTNADQITGTMVIQQYPEEVFKEIKRLEGKIERRYPGIYYITGLIHMPTQVIVKPELSEVDNAALRKLIKAAIV